jgi:hypothetical protein
MMGTLMQLGYQMAPQILGMVLGGGGGGGGGGAGGGLAELASAFLGAANAAKPAAAVNTKLTTTADKTDKIGGVSVSLFENKIFC